MRQSIITNGPQGITLIDPVSGGGFNFAACFTEMLGYSVGRKVRFPSTLELAILIIIINLRLAALVVRSGAQRQSYSEKMKLL